MKHCVLAHRFGVFSLFAKSKVQFEPDKEARPWLFLTFFHEYLHLLKNVSVLYHILVYCQIFLFFLCYKKPPSGEGGWFYL